MKQHLLAIIAVLAAIILALISIETANNPYSARSYRTYSYNPVPNALNGTGAGTLYVSQEDNTGSVVALPAESNATTESFLTLPEAGSPLVAPPAMLATSAMTELTPVQLPPLDAGMVNVTGGFDGNSQTAGYRVNPRPGEFAIAVPYDPSLLPQGFTENDIQTYVYDRQYLRWVAIQRDSVNETELLVCSRFRPWEKGLPHTQNDLSNPQDALSQVQDMMSFASQGEGGGDSPLDFINAVLKTPEMPETSAYTPTSIKELKAADPLEGLTLMQPPTANNSGTANLSYPIEIPAGRQGMQPNLALTYNSGGGNGWLGVGWDIPIPSITVETRWGVPRYRTAWESEVYVYEGEQLLTKDGAGEFRKMAHRTNDTLGIQRISGDVQHFPRRNEAFDSIVRHGYGPSDYWWSVTHRNGVTDYYGKKHGVDEVDYGSVLCDPIKHNIAQWMLTESVDPSGNRVRYSYHKESQKSVAFSSVNSGTQIYADEISYTGHDSAEAQYHIKFNLNDNKRRDVVTNGRYGFREVTASTLCNVEVLYKDTVIRRYYFMTENSRESNFKTRLINLVRADGPENDFVMDCANITDSDSWLTNNANMGGLEGQETKVDLFRTHFDYYDYPSADSLFGSAKHISNLESDNLMSAFSRDNRNATALGATRGFGYNGGGTVSVGVANKNLVITDFNVGGNFSYGQSFTEGLLTLIDLNGDGLADKVFKQGEQVLYRPQVIDPSDSLLFYFGAKVPVSGIDAFLQEESHQGSFGVQGSVMAVVAASAGMPSTVSTISTYFTDINGDGLPDLVTEQGALFNSLDTNGNPHFTSVNSQRTDPDNGTMDMDQMIVTSATAPCGGIIFDGVADPDIDCEYHYIKDSVIVEHDNDTTPEIMALLADTTVIPIGFLDNIFYYYHLYPVTSHCGPMLKEPDLDAVRVWLAPFDGIITIRSNVRMLPDSSESYLQSRYADGVICAIEKHDGCRVNENMELHSRASSFLSRDTLLLSDTLFSEAIYQFGVRKNDILFFRLQSKEDRSYDNVEWNLDIDYNGISGIDEYGVDSARYSSYEDFVLTSKNVFQAPKQGTVRLTGTLTGNPGVNAGRLYITHGTTKDSIDIMANTSNILPIDRTYTLNDSDIVMLEIKGNGGSNLIWGNLECQTYLTFLEDTSDHLVSIPEELSCYLPVRLGIQYGDSSDNAVALRKFFGPLYRGWGQFAYKNDSSSESQPIVLASLRLPAYLRDDSYTADSVSIANALDPSQFQMDITTYTTNLTVASLSATIDSIFNPLSENTRWVEMTPDMERYRWTGFGNTTSISKEGMSNTRQKRGIAVLNDDSYPYDMTVTQEMPEYDHPVPVSVNGYPVQTIRKMNFSIMGNGSLSVIGSDGGDEPSLSMGGSVSGGANYVISDYLDLNGDRYPDLLDKKSVQYTMPWGGIGVRQILNPEQDELCNSNTSSGGSTFSGSYPTPKREAGGNTQRAKITIDGLGGSIVESQDETSIMYLDVNGDGLPDRIYSTGEVALNKGYAFDSKEAWGAGAPRTGSSVSESANAGANFSLEQVSIGGGRGQNQSENLTESMLMDFNGDGLPDKVRKDGVSLKVCYNFGNGEWSGEEVVPGASQISQSHSFSENGNGALTLGFEIEPFVKIQAGIQLSPYNSTFSRDNAQLTDINGDGHPDYVTSVDEENMTVRYNTAAKTNLLKKVTNFTGSTITLDYDMPLSCYEKPQRGWNLASVEVDDPGSPLPAARSLTRFSYSDPHYNRYERMDFGYGKVTTSQYDTEGGDSLYRYTVEEFENRVFTKRGRKTRDCLYNAGNRPYVEHLYDATVFDFAGHKVSEDSCSRSDVYVGVESDLTNWYEGQPSAQVTSRVVYEYDRYRNVTRYIHHGDTTHKKEYFEAEIGYANGMPHNLVSLPVRIRVKAADSTVLQLRTASYTDSGKLRQLVCYASPSDSAVYDYTYNCFGNPDTCRFPENVLGQRLAFAYQYDNEVHTYPVQVKNIPLYFCSITEYNYKFGKPIKTIDINGNELHYTYDRIGRCTSVLAPYEADINTGYTIRMTYVPKNFNRLDIFTSDTTRQSYACTFHYDPEHPDNNLRTVVLSDGLGRLLQTKKDAEIGGNEKCLVTGRTVYDCFGRTVVQYQPFAEALGAEWLYNDSVTPGTATTVRYDILNRQTYMRTPMNIITTMAYDFDTCYGKQCLRTTVTDPKGNKVKTLTGTLGQQLKQVAPMNTVTWFKYDALGRLDTVIDPDNIGTYYAYDMLGRMIQRVHPDAGTDRYHYDAAGNLLSHVNALADSILYRYHYNQLTDVEFPRYPANNVHYLYGTPTDTNINAVGKIIFQEDASGWQTFKYGKLGELTENIRTFALPFESQTYTFKMQYKYDSYNRIQKMTYPDGEVVQYDYNRGGLLKKVYGTVKGDFLPQYPSTPHDSLVPLNLHGLGGQATLNSLPPVGDPVPLYDTHTYPYIDSIAYNEFELKSDVFYGNGTHALYAYDSLLRLLLLQSQTRTGDIMQDIVYTYDSVGNITGIANGAGMLPNGMGGTYNSTYTYDDLYRLTSSTGGWQGSQNISYRTTTLYRGNGCIKQKNLAARKLLNGVSDTVNYSHYYHYGNTSQPNTLTRYSSSVWDPGSWLGISNEEDSQFGWDAAGNMTESCIGDDRNCRSLCWDEQNRLQGVKDNKWLSYYQYDAAGDRTYKLTGKGDLQNISGIQQYYYLLENATLYASPYLVATDKGYTKHYYAESERLASRIGGGRLSDLDHPTVDQDIIIEREELFSGHIEQVLKNCLNTKHFDLQTTLYKLYDWRDSLQTETDCYWYHPDHLGSSSWVTDTGGTAVQHLHYLPWGEDYVNQRLNSFDGVRYTFSAKERDAETGLSYFGSRYYSSDLSVWLSVDPMSDKYPSLSPYTYCADNPVKLVDPNGEDWYEKDGKMYYTTQYTSNEAFQKSGIKGTYKGKFFAEKGTYYSLFGDEIDMTTEKGFIKACMTQKIDEAFQNYANYLKAARNNNETPSFDAEPHSWDYPSQKQTDFSGVYKFEEGGATNNYHNPNELGKYANSADIYLFVSKKRMMGELDSFNRGLKYDRVHGVNGYGAIEGYLLQFKNYSGRVENPIVVLRFPSEESVRTFQAKFKNLFNIK